LRRANLYATKDYWVPIVARSAFYTFRNVTTIVAFVQARLANLTCSWIIRN